MVLENTATYRKENFLGNSETRSSCTFLTQGRNTHKHYTQKHTPGIPLYSRRQTVILLVAIWRKWQYEGLNWAVSYTCLRVRELAHRYQTQHDVFIQILTVLLSFLPLCEEATTARYWMTFLVFSVFPAPDSPLEWKK